MSILGTAADFGDSEIEDFPTIHETSGYSGTVDNLKGSEWETLQTRLSLRQPLPRGSRDWTRTFCYHGWMIGCLFLFSNQELAI